jgi:hypothetical protein
LHDEEIDLNAVKQRRTDEAVNSSLVIQQYKYHIDDDQCDQRDHPLEPENN